MTYRAPMERMLEQMEEDLAITNPKEPFRTFLRKLRYRWALFRARRRRHGAGPESGTRP